VNQRQITAPFKASSAFFYSPAARIVSTHGCKPLHDTHFLQLQLPMRMPTRPLMLPPPRPLFIKPTMCAMSPHNAQLKLQLL